MILLTKKDVQQRVLKNGKPLALKRFSWDEKTNTFSSSESNLEIDFKDINNCVFNVVSSFCTFRTGGNCTFDTGGGCTFNTGYNCTFRTGGNCTFRTSFGCTFKTGFDCKFITGHSCTFDTKNNCTFNTGVYCTFKTGNICKFNTGYNCIFDTEYDCTFDTDYGCTFNTGPTCVFRTGSACVFNTQHNCTFNCYRTAIITNKSQNNILILRNNFTNEIYNLDTLEKDKMIYFIINEKSIIKQIKKVELIDGQLVVINSKKRFQDYQIYYTRDIKHYLNDINKMFKIVSKEYNGRTYYSHCETIKKGIEDVNFKIARKNYNLNEIAQQIKDNNNIINWYDYRLITGACEFGTKQWLKQNNYTTDDTMNISEFYEKYKEQHPYGFDKFEKFYKEWFK